jgi:hypothetical protein
MAKLYAAILTVFQTIIVLGASGAIALAETSTVSEFKPARFVIEYKNDLITAEFYKAPLAKVLQELEKKTGARSILKDLSLSNDPLSIKLKGSTLEKALKRILKNYTNAIYFDSSGAVIKVIIFGAKNGYSRNSAKIAAYTNSLPATPEADQTAPANSQFIESSSNLDESQPLTSSQQTREVGNDIGENVEPLDESSPNADDAPYDLDDYQSLPEELPGEAVGSYEDNEQDPEASRLAAEKQANLEELRQQVRLERSLSALESEHSHLRVMAVEELVRIKDPRVASALASVANSDTASAAERRQATQALWHHAADLEFANSEANQAVRSLARDSDPSVRDIAKRALIDMGRYQRR